MNQNISMRGQAGAADAAPSRPATLLKVEREITTTAYREVEGRPVPIPASARWAVGALIGAGALIGLTGFANDRIETQLVERTRESLSDAGLDPADYAIDFDFRDGTVTGTLPDGWAATRFLAELTVDGASSVEFEERPVAASLDGDS